MGNQQWEIAGNRPYSRETTRRNATLMFDVLLESRKMRSPRPLFAATVSTALHVGIVAAGIGGAAVVATSPEMNPIWDQLARFLAPPNAPSVVGGERVSFVALTREGSTKGEDAGVPVPVKEEAKDGEAVVPAKEAQEVRLSDVMELAEAAQTVGAFTIIDVDSIAERDPTSAAPVYPPVLLTRGIEGSAVMRFVIDSTGRVDMSTVRVMDATHQEFARAVRDAMPRMKFRPAKRGAVPVRQLVEQPYMFRIEAPPPTRRRPPGPDGARSA